MAPITWRKRIAGKKCTGNTERILTFPLVLYIVGRPFCKCYPINDVQEAGKNRLEVDFRYPLATGCAVLSRATQIDKAYMAITWNLTRKPQVHHIHHYFCHKSRYVTGRLHPPDGMKFCRRHASRQHDIQELS